MSEEVSEIGQNYLELMKFVVGSLIDPGTEFNVEVEEDDDHVRLNVLVPGSVRGQVIGRGGRIARAMRSMVSAADIGPANLKLTVDIVD
jgi:hypothetical protein